MRTDQSDIRSGDAGAELDADAGNGGSDAVHYSLLRSVSDDVVLALLRAGKVSTDQVTRALDDTGLPDQPLWRRLLTDDSIDRSEVFEAAARTLRLPRATVVDAQSALNLHDSLRSSHSAYWMDAVIACGAVPVDSRTDPRTGRLTVAFATPDPQDEELVMAIEGLGVVPDVRYAPVTAVEPILRRIAGDGANDPDLASGHEPDTTEQPPDDPRIERDLVVTSLLRRGHATTEQVAMALESFDRAPAGETLWRRLARLDGVDRDGVFEEAATVYAFRSEELGEGRPDLDFAVLILQTMSREQRDRLLDLNVVPFDYDHDSSAGELTLLFVTHDPARAEAHHLLGRVSTTQFELRYAPESEVRELVARIRLSLDESPVPVEDVLDGFDFDVEARTGQPSPGTSPVAGPPAAVTPSSAALEPESDLLEEALFEAVSAGATDIHVYPNADHEIEIHFRTDGRLGLWKRDGGVRAEVFLDTIKSGLGSSEATRADAVRDGFIQRRYDGESVRFRVSVLPIATAVDGARAESIVVRVLDNRRLIGDPEGLGLGEDVVQKLKQAVRKSQGMVIVAGPAGAGKSTTLASTLKSLIRPEVSVLSLEDPIEFILDGVRHIQLSHTLDLEAGLRAVLRHDPDIVMLGEVRSRTAADLAAKLANTGHLTLSTLQNGDTVSSIAHLLRLGVDPFKVAYAVNLVVAQRLVRRLCEACRVGDDRRDPVLMRRLGFTDDEILSESIYRAGQDTECGACGGAGYQGRSVVAEALYFSTPVRHLIAESGATLDEDALRELAASEGMTPLEDAVRRMVITGQTSVDEMRRTAAAAPD